MAEYPGVENERRFATEALYRVVRRRSSSAAAWHGA